MKQSTLLNFFGRPNGVTTTARKHFDALYERSFEEARPVSPARDSDAPHSSRAEIEEVEPEPEGDVVFRVGAAKPTTAEDEGRASGSGDEAAEGSQSQSSESDEEAEDEVADMLAKSDYERQRAERMQRNREALLRLVGSKSCAAMVGAGRSGPPRAKKKPKRPPKQKTEPVRRSRRKAALPVLGPGTPSDGEGDVSAPSVVVEEETLDFAPTAVADYDCAADATTSGVSALRSHDSGVDEAFSKLRVVSPEPTATCMRRVYSIDFDESCARKDRDGTLVVAGEKGLASILAVLSTGGTLPLLDCKLSRSWIASVEFVGRGAERLLSASNDGEVNLWNLCLSAWDPKVGANVPSNLFSHRAHDKGIFSMCHRENKVLTGSKDCTVGLSLMAESSIRTVAYYDEIHSGVVKSVAFGAGEGEFASAGNDRDIRLCDLRADPNKGSGVIEGAHHSAINGLQYSPDGTLLLSSSFDPILRVHDLRNPAAPLLELQGHLAGRAKSIQGPVFAAGGRRVVATGERTGLLTIYDCTGSGALVSHGSMDFNPSKLCSVDGGDLTFMAAAGQGELSLLKPSM